MAGLVKSSQAVTCVFCTSLASTGASSDADSLPTGTLYVNGVANGASVTVTNITTGVYKAAVTLPSLSAGDVVDIRIAATVSTVAGNGVVWSAIGDTVRLSDSTPQTGDSFARIGVAGAGLTAVGDTSGTTTLLLRLSSARAGYLDNLSGGAVALASALATAQADLTTLVSRITGAVSLATATTAAAIRSALGMASANLDTQLGALPSGSDVVAIKAKTDNLPSDPADQSQVESAITTAQSAIVTAIGGLNDLSATQVTAIVAAGDDATLAAIAALNDLSPTEAQAAVAAALAAYPVPLIADIEAAIAAGSGATPATFWQYTGPGGRTLTQSMVAILSSMIQGNKITVTRGDTCTIPIIGLGDLSGRDGLWFTVKMHPAHESDEQAKIQVTEDDGLLRLNGEAATAGDAAITVDDEVNGDITITLSAATMAALNTSGTFPSRTAVKSWSWRWDVQVRQPGPGVWTPRSGAFVVEEDVTRTT